MGNTRKMSIDYTYQMEHGSFYQLVERELRAGAAADSRRRSGNHARHEQCNRQQRNAYHSQSRRHGVVLQVHHDLQDDQHRRRREHSIGQCNRTSHQHAIHPLSIQRLDLYHGELRRSAAIAEALYIQIST